MAYIVWIDGNIEAPDESFDLIEKADVKAIEHYNSIKRDPNFTCGGYSTTRIVVSSNGEELYHYGY